MQEFVEKWRHIRFGAESEKKLLLDGMRTLEHALEHASQLIALIALDQCYCDIDIAIFEFQSVDGFLLSIAFDRHHQFLESKQYFCHFADLWFAVHFAKQPLSQALDVSRVGRV